MIQNLETNQVEPLGSIDGGGLPLGIDEDAQYEMSSATIPRESWLLLYTDGLEEAFPDSAGHAEFGREGIENSLRESRLNPLPAALNALFGDSSQFTNGAGRHDDTSVLLIERKP